MPVTQEQISQHLVGTTYRHPEDHSYYEPKGPFDEQRERVNQVSRADDNYQNLKVGLRDMDDALAFYFKEVIRPRAMVDKNFVEVPLTYATPEKWKSAQRDGQYRDKTGKRQLPVAIFKRNSIKKVRNMANKLDANRPHNWYLTHVFASRRNPYTEFDKVTNRAPEREFIYTVVPDFVKLDYSIIILTDFIEQMNPIIEAINFASDSYWGRQEKFKFQAFVGDIRTDVMGNQSEDRTVKAEFNVTLNGYIVPETVSTGPYVNYKGRNKTTLRIGMKEQTVKNRAF